MCKDGGCQGTPLCSEKVTFDLSPKGSEDVSHMGIWRKSIPGTERVSSSPEVGVNECVR